jgi:amino-acid N-acetyltransferase
VTVEEAGSLIDHNISKTPGKALELLARGYEACRSGVKRVHIIDGRVEGILLKEIFSNRGFGTMIYSNQYENIRQMQHKDIPFVLSIMEDAVEDGCLVPRTAAYLEEKINDYFVYEVDGTLHGCGALHSFSNKTAEISSIAVDGSYTNLGIGNKIVAFLIESASKLKMKTVFVLTTQTSDWFDKLGFTEGTLDDLPAERRETYDKSRNSRIMLYKFSAMRLKGQLQAE